MTSFLMASLQKIEKFFENLKIETRMFPENHKLSKNQQIYPKVNMHQK